MHSYRHIDAHTQGHTHMHARTYTHLDRHRHHTQLHNCKQRVLTPYIIAWSASSVTPCSMQFASPEELTRPQTSCCSGRARRSPGQQRWLPSAVAAIQKADQSVVGPAAEALQCSAECPWHLVQLGVGPAELLLVPVNPQGCPLRPACQ